MKKVKVFRTDLTIKMNKSLTQEQLDKLKHDLAFVLNNYEARVGFLEDELEIDRILVGEIKDAGI